MQFVDFGGKCDWIKGVNFCQLLPCFCANMEVCDDNDDENNNINNNNNNNNNNNKYSHNNTCNYRVYICHTIIIY